LHWPVRSRDHAGHAGAPRGQFSRGKGRFVAAEHVPPAELPDEQYPLMLTTGRVIYHWHGAEMTRRARGLNEVYPEALIEVSPKDAQRAGVADGELIRLASRRGEIVAKAQVTSRVGAGLVFATFHFPESAANFLTNPALDPVAKDTGVQGVRGEDGCKRAPPVSPPPHVHPMRHMRGLVSRRAPIWSTPPAPSSP
jgi:predicted molibdopterin-dependent oxidoreductase YjgC